MSDSLQHTLGSVAPQVIGQRISAVQGRFHIQAANEILGMVLVEVKSQLGHICPLLPAPAELVSGGAVLETHQPGQTGADICSA